MTLLTDAELARLDAAVAAWPKEPAEIRHHRANDWDAVTQKAFERVNRHNFSSGAGLPILPARQPHISKSLLDLSDEDS